ncbi:hypothetical protein JIN85_10100 [Luteolibacter pohnpeiensis]|uniref:Uncharacterized protein n=1 Tax=Luteolibacter pohnpeiensis TaxID=454153 RepID=A0A934SCJ5_9BACT|nr:hypothetical protein [Luteolibacter pohnpeiensis]MBK1882768.1 hypothetical protein [Luteolibacter pohnpeiensis]
MQATILPCFALILALSACAPGGPPTSAPVAASQLSATQKAAIGRKIWQNESGGTVAGLTAWNSGEEFPSLGIGHFIWYPAGFNGRFEQSWPLFIAFAKSHGANPPPIAMERNAPWKTRAAFQAEFNSGRMTGLRNWLAANVELQTDFIISRSRAALPKILSAAPASERAKISGNYHKVATTPQGTYALIDYVNFKGDGTQTSERYNGQGWGLMQVLGGMHEVSAGPAAAAEFAASAKRVLSRRVSNSPPARAEAKWLPGWHNRCDTYARPL